MITPAKTCYTHIGGKLGSLLLQAFITRGWLEKDSQGKHYHVTKIGTKGFRRLGIDLTQIKSEKNGDD